MNNLRIQSFYIGANNRKSALDALIPKTDPKKVILFVHGYKGFKDWGAWNALQYYFALQNIAFVKINLSHNGGTIDTPIDFPDLDAFSRNTYSKEVHDIKAAINWIKSCAYLKHLPVTLIGHSRGGAGVILAAKKNKYVHSVVTLASICSIEERFPTDRKLEQWLNTGIRFERNTRTKQNMPVKIDIYKDYVANKVSLNIQNACKSLAEQKTPMLHIHGSKDEAVSLENSIHLSKWSSGSIKIIEGANHTFESKHPHGDFKLPNELRQAALYIHQFITNH